MICVLWLCEFGEFSEEFGRCTGARGKAAVLDHSIGDRHILRSYGHVINRCLVERALCQFDGKRLAFDQHPGFARTVIDEDIRSLLQRVVHQTSLNPKQGFWIIQMMNEVIQHVLAYPLFRSENHVLLAHCVKNEDLSLTLLNFDIKGRQVEGRHKNEVPK